MGDVISLQDHLDASGLRAGPTACFFDLGEPATYLAAERVDRLLAGVRWRPARLPEPLVPPDPEALLARAEELGLPLVSVAQMPATRAMRVAAYAAGEGRCAAFVLAASRLAYCGGFDLEDPETLTEAAAAAGLNLRASLHAAGDAELDVPIEAAGHRLARAGVRTLPVVRAGHLLFPGEARVGEAATALRAQGA